MKTLSVLSVGGAFYHRWGAGFGLYSGWTDSIVEAIEILTNCGAIEYARNLAQESVVKAKEVLEILPDSSSKQVLADIADFVLERSA